MKKDLQQYMYNLRIPAIVEVVEMVRALDVLMFLSAIQYESHCLYSVAQWLCQGIPSCQSLEHLGQGEYHSYCFVEKGWRLTDHFCLTSLSRVKACLIQNNTFI